MSGVIRPVRFNVIAAMCSNGGIGKNGQLPWRLRCEMAFFTFMTKATRDKTKKNVVIMGRKTWESLKYKPLPNRINFVISRTDIDMADYKDAYCEQSFDEIMDTLNSDHCQDKFESVWVIGGRQIYDIALQSPNFFRLYLTKIYNEYDCDTFFPAIPPHLMEVKVQEVPDTIQEEDSVAFQHFVYENPNC